MDSPSEKKSKSLFSRLNKPSLTAPSSNPSRTVSPPTSETTQVSSTSASSFGSLYDPKITQGLQDDAVHARALQSSSNLLGRLKWASEDRSQFFSAIEDLTRANDLLESLLRIKPPQDGAFFAAVSEADHDAKNTIYGIRNSLQKLHRDLLAMNPNGREIEFCLKLALDANEKETYADHVDNEFDANSTVFALQAHSKSKHADENKSYYILAETSHSEDTKPSAITNMVAAFGDIDLDADPEFQCLGENQTAERDRANLRVFQDKTSEWERRQTLANALQDQNFQDICFQKNYIQLGLFMAFSYAVLPFTFKGKTSFPQPTNYLYYDQVSLGSREPTSGSRYQDGNTDTSDPEDAFTESRPTIEERFQDLQSPYIKLSFGSRPRNIGTKALGKKPGFTAPTNNPVVSLGLLLYQIGSWQHMPAGNIVQMRRDALDRTHDLIRLSGVEFADITRMCLNWKENGKEEKKSDSDDMLIKIYARIDEYNKALQELL